MMGSGRTLSAKVFPSTVIYSSKRYSTVTLQVISCSFISFSSLFSPVSPLGLSEIRGGGGRFFWLNQSNKSGCLDGKLAGLVGSRRDVSKQVALSQKCSSRRE